MAIVVERNVERITTSENLLETVEICGKTCYKSDPSDAESFIKRIIRLGHESVLEHGVITYRIICDRSTSHQIVRHRMFSYSQESQRYCRYDKEKFGNQIAYIVPADIPENFEKVLHNCVEASESHYFNLLELGIKAETARAVLPNCTKTELMMTGNMRAWRNFLKTRLDKHAQSDIIDIARMIVKDMDSCDLSVFIEDLGEENEDS